MPESASIAVDSQDVLRTFGEMRAVYYYNSVRSKLDKILNNLADQADFENFAANYSQYVSINDDTDIPSKLAGILLQYKGVIKAKKDKNGNWYLKKVKERGVIGFLKNMMTKPFVSRSDPKNVAAAMLSQEAPPRPEKSSVMKRIAGTLASFGQSSSSDEIDQGKTLELTSLFNEVQNLGLSRVFENGFDPLEGGVDQGFYKDCMLFKTEFPFVASISGLREINNVPVHKVFDDDDPVIVKKTEDGFEVELDSAFEVLGAHQTFEDSSSYHVFVDNLQRLVAIQQQFNRNKDRRYDAAKLGKQRSVESAMSFQKRAVLLVDDDSYNLEVAQTMGIDPMFAGEDGMSVETMNSIAAWGTSSASTQCSLRALDWDGTCTLNSIHMANDINYMSEFIFNYVERKVQGSKVSYRIREDSISRNSRNPKLRGMAERALSSINKKLEGMETDVHLLNRSNQTRLGKDLSDSNLETRGITAEFIVDNYKDMRALALHMLEHTDPGNSHYDYATRPLDFQRFTDATDTLNLMFGDKNRQEALLNLYLSADKDNPIAITSHGTEPSVMRALLVKLVETIRPGAVDDMKKKLKDQHIICNNNSVNKKGRKGTSNAEGYVGKTAQILAVLNDLPQPAQVSKADALYAEESRARNDAVYKVKFEQINEKIEQIRNGAELKESDFTDLCNLFKLGLGTYEATALDKLKGVLGTNVEGVEGLQGLHIKPFLEGRYRLALSSDVYRTDAVASKLYEAYKGKTQSAILVPPEGMGAKAALDSIMPKSSSGSQSSSQTSQRVILVDDSKTNCDAHAERYGASTVVKVDEKIGMTVKDMEDIKIMQDQAKEEGKQCITLLDMDKTTLAGHHLTHSLEQIKNMAEPNHKYSTTIMGMLNNEAGTLFKEKDGKTGKDVREEIKEWCIDKHPDLKFQNIHKVLGENKTGKISQAQIDFIWDNYRDLSLVAEVGTFMRGFDVAVKKQKVDRITKLYESTDTCELLFGNEDRQKALVNFYIESAKKGVAAVASHGSDPEIMKGFLIKLADKHGRGKAMSALFKEGKLICDERSVNTAGIDKNKHDQAGKVTERATEILGQSTTFSIGGASHV
ncbi:hypothetical protein MMH89_02970 [Candidatus Comchoanobacter bicostacola]|uniref:Uncharacterized protein n=1 Tax=Candidatus Comchoanobacter bicostacola TaxID=2919598 RepID=A0ABY5DKD1_9GAMM|nr:hypothetical protein [Candidatus Comchoanobacter bicostacola]UTC24184.1 hypothetical protein MMH89_02970 [Candidatus Comchoanobacter bicostacola]